MKNSWKTRTGWLCIWLLQIGLALGASNSVAPLTLGTPVGGKDKFDVLQAGTETYQNVTVTSKGTNYIFITHSKGMGTVKLASLTPELRAELGYAPPPVPKTQQALQALKSVEVPKLSEDQAERVDAELARVFGGRVPPVQDLREEVKPWMVFAGFGAVAALYLFFCFCAHLICKKAGHPPGLLVWIPILQIFPLLKAANMSGWWFLGWILPLIGLVVQIVWCFKIVQARGKSTLVAILMLLPITNLFAFLFLAFSSGVTPSRGGRQPGRTPLSLETA